MKPELVMYTGAELLEGPVWDAKNMLIYCVSIEQKMFYSFDPSDGFVCAYRTDGQVGCVYIDKDGNIISAEEAGIFKTEIASGKREFLIQLNDDPKMRYNDGKYDPVGRLLVGTKGLLHDYPGEGAVFSWDGTNVKKIINGTTISNGLGFSLNNKFLYFIDTPKKVVSRYHYSTETGDAIFDKDIISFDGDSFPDGMCVDLDGNIWVAEWGGSRVCKWNPDNGEKVSEIQLPCKFVSSCCLGGDNLKTLYITTAKNGEKNTLGGGLFTADITDV